ncbi:MAG: hypothetical protein AAGI44_14420, partial [Pseudomonadota bacterium]
RFQHPNQTRPVGQRRFGCARTETEVFFVAVNEASPKTLACRGFLFLGGCVWHTKAYEATAPAMTDPAMPALKYYWNAIVMLLSVTGYVLAASTLYIPTLASWAPAILTTCMPLLFCFAFGFTAGVVIAALQLVYSVFTYVSRSGYRKRALHHCAAAVLWGMGVGLFAVAAANGLILTV